MRILILIAALLFGAAPAAVTWANAQTDKETHPMNRTNVGAPEAVEEDEDYPIITDEDYPYLDDDYEPAPEPLPEAPVPAPAEPQN